MAVVAPRGVAVVAVDTTAGSADVVAVGVPLFRARPALTVVQVAWHPRAEDYLLVLTSDGSLRLFDVAGGADVEAERTRLRIVTTGDVPISFAFGKGDGWNGLAVYVLTEHGSVYVASPIAPLGTRISRQQWCAMVSESEAILDQQGVGRGTASASASGSMSASAMASGRKPASNVILEETSAPMASSGDLPPLGGMGGSGTRSGIKKGAKVPDGPPARGGRLPVSTPRRQLNFGGLDDDKEHEEAGVAANVELAASGGSAASAHTAATSRGRLAAAPGDNDDLSWTVRQARLQLRFLERAFQQTESGDMLLIREFKPAPLLFQGPLYVERDDIDEQGDEDVCFTSLTVLDSGSHVPPILLRCRSDGHVSVLLGMEAVEGQWFISEDRFGTTGDSVLAASEEYAKAASVVSPSLLCLEHLEFPAREPVLLHAVRGRTDFDVLFARAGSAIYSVRLNFVSAMRAPETLRSCRSSLITPLLSVGRIGGAGRLTGSPSSTIVGLSPFFEKECGPLAIALTSDHALEATAPLRWMADEQDDMFLETLVAPGAVQSEVPIGVGEALSSAGGSRAQGASDGDFSLESARNLRGSGLEVVETLQAVREARNVESWALGTGSIGSVADASSVSDVLTCLESRVMAYTGDDESGRRGVGDELKTLGLVLPKWAGEVLSRAGRADGGMALVSGELEKRVTESEALAVKLRRVQEMNQNLRDRVDCLREIHSSRQSVLSNAEVARFAKLKKRRLHVAAMRRKIDEVSSAVSALTTAAGDAAARQRLSDVGAMRTPGIDNSIGQLSISPLMNRRMSSPYRPAYSEGRRRGSTGVEQGDLSGAQLLRIKETLAEQSKNIHVATEKTNLLWQKFGSV